MKNKVQNKHIPVMLNEVKSFIPFDKEINYLTFYHYKNSKDYKKILDSIGYKLKNSQLNAIPFLPAKLFKEYDMLSVSKKKILKILHSSGTSGSKPARIHLDRENSYLQIKVLSKIMSTILGNQRLPMLIIDQNPKLLDRSIISAKTAAIYGFSIFGKNQTYLLNKKNKIDYHLLNDFLKKYGNKSFFIFGFTSSIFKNLIRKWNFITRRWLEKNGKN